MSDIKIFFEAGQKFERRNINPLVGIVGLYFIYNEELKIQYPFYKSKLIYIGMSEKRTNSIGRRLQGHLEGTSGNEGIINYQKANGVSFTYINFEMLKNMWSLSIESLESYFILSFVQRYGVYPICNNKTRFEIQGAELARNLIIDWDFFENEQ